MKPKTLAICSKYKDDGCKKTCPLAKACVTHDGESHAMWADRMNLHAELVELKGWP